MFGPRPAQIVMPSGKALHALAVEAVVTAHPVTEELCKPIQLPKHLFEKARDAWAKFRGPVEDTNDFWIELELFDTKHGFVVLIVEFSQGRVDIGAEVYDEDGKLDFELFASDAREAQEQPEDAGFLEELWQEIRPVATIRQTEKYIGPNSPCSCGSGKKFKKCCMNK